MVDFDKFEKQVKDKYGNQEFPFDEQNWEKAAKMIDASRKGKNRGGIILFSAVALLCTSGLVYYFGFSDSNKQLKENTLAVNEAPINSEKFSNEINEQPASQQNASENPVSENVTPGENTNSVNETLYTENKTVSNNTTPSSNTKKTNSVNSLKTNPKPDKENNVAESNANSNPASNTKTEAETNSNSHVAPETKAGETKNTSAQKTTTTKTNTKTPPVLGNNVAQNSVKPVSVNVSGNETGNTEKLGDVSSTSETPAKTNTTVSDSSDNIVAAAVKPAKNSVMDSVPAIRKSKADSLAAMMPTGDGVSYATNVKAKEIHNAKNILFMEAGTTYLFGWNGGGKNDANGFNLLAGINFQHYFTNSISAQIGVQYNSIGNLTNTTHTISNVKYDFGIEQDVTSIKYQRLHYVVAPLKIVFNAGEKNYIGIGCNIGYLLNSESKKEKYKTNSSDPNANKKDLTSTKETGYVQGFNPIDIQASISYRRRIYKGLSANAEFIYGLTDTKNNSFFKSNTFDRNMGVKVSLCFDLFKK